MGGIGSKLGGGSFSEGAVIAIIGHEFDERRHRIVAYVGGAADIHTGTVIYMTDKKGQEIFILSGIKVNNWLSG